MEIRHVCKLCKKAYDKRKYVEKIHRCDICSSITGKDSIKYIGKLYIDPENEYLLPLIKLEAKRLGISESEVIVRALKKFFQQ